MGGKKKPESLWKLEKKFRLIDFATGELLRKKIKWRRSGRLAISLR